MSENSNRQFEYTQNRELSWLRFNRRVLEEAADTAVPLLERLKFVSIFSNNLDEFFMVRVGSLFDIAKKLPQDTDNKTGWTAKQQLEKIYRAIPPLMDEKEQIYTEIMSKLKQNGIKDVTLEELLEKEKQTVFEFFENQMLPALSPIILLPQENFAHFANKKLYAAALLEAKGKEALGIVPLPDTLPTIKFLPDGRRFIRTENILIYFLKELFGCYSVKESCLFCLTRNADISLDDERLENGERELTKRVENLLKTRERMTAVRLELSKKISHSFKLRLAGLLKVEEYQIFTDRCPINTEYAYELIKKLPKEISKPLLYRPYEGRSPKEIPDGRSVLKQIKQGDKLLFYPYDSVETFLNFLNNAADDPNVCSVKITIYRLAAHSKIVHTLCRAAENGKEVVVIIELRARFEEQKNLKWAKTMERSGCRVIYGVKGLKCHCKICLVTLKREGEIGYITQIGTGNYNEQTSTLYTDLSLMTGDLNIGKDASDFFDSMLNLKPKSVYRRLAFSPLGIKNLLFEKIDQQIRLGNRGYICIKANSVTERDVIDKLREASRAGVEVQLIVRGICCILPGISGHTDNIHVTSIVGRYLEHARVYLFGKDREQSVYISSADLMTRNLNRRIEIACPVHDPILQRRLKQMLDCQLLDSVKARTLLSDGSYVINKSDNPFDSQAYFMEKHSPNPEP